jgi:parallel beta-helix repeat protein
MYSADSNTVIGNTISCTSYGSGNACIWLYFSDDNSIGGNTVSGGDDGIYLWSSDSNTVSGNTISGSTFGIVMRDSSSATIINNVMTDCGINIYGNSLEYWNIHTIDTSNTVNGKPVYYWKNATGGTVPSDAGQVILAGCTNVVVEKECHWRNGTFGCRSGYTRGLHECCG